LINWKNIFPRKTRYFETERGILYNNDSQKILKEFPSNSIDLVITSPPYNVGVKYDTYDDNHPLEDYLLFMEDILRELYRILKPDGRIIINILIDVKMNNIRVSPIAEYYFLFKKVGLKYNSIIRLNEIQPHRIKYTAWGSWLSQSAPYIYNPEEYAIIGYKEQWRKQNCEKDDIDKDLFIELVSGRWDYRAETKKWTEANFSEDFPYRAMKILSCKNEIILDPFAGSGTTLVVANKLKKKWIGIELSENYCQVAKERLIGKNKQQELF